MKNPLLVRIAVLLALALCAVGASAQDVTGIGKQDPDLTLIVAYPATARSGQTVDIQCLLENNVDESLMYGFTVSLSGGGFSFFRALPGPVIGADDDLDFNFSFAAPAFSKPTVLTGMVVASEDDGSESYVPVTITIMPAPKTTAAIGPFKIPGH